MRAHDSSSSSVKLYRSTAVLVDLPCCGHCSFSMCGVIINKLQHQSVIILQRHITNIVVPDVLSRLSCAAWTIYACPVLRTTVSFFDAPSYVANFHDLSRYSGVTPLYQFSEWSRYSGTLPCCHVPSLYRDLDCSLLSQGKCLVISGGVYS